MNGDNMAVRQQKEKKERKIIKCGVKKLKRNRSRAKIPSLTEE